MAVIVKEQLQKAVLDYVEKNPGCKCADIREDLAAQFPGIRKKDVNQILYSEEKVGSLVREGDLSEGAPTWKTALATA